MLGPELPNEFAWEMHSGVDLVLFYHESEVYVRRITNF